MKSVPDFPLCYDDICAFLLVCESAIDYMQDGEDSDSLETKQAIMSTRSLMRKVESRKPLTGGEIKNIIMFSDTYISQSRSEISFLPDKQRAELRVNLKRVVSLRRKLSELL